MNLQPSAPGQRRHEKSQPPGCKPRIVHPEGCEDAAFHELLVSRAGNLLENRVQQKIAQVAVLEPGSGSKAQITAARLGEQIPRPWFSRGLLRLAETNCQMRSAVNCFVNDPTSNSALHMVRDVPPPVSKSKSTLVQNLALAGYQH